MSCVEFSKFSFMQYRQNLFCKRMSLVVTDVLRKNKSKAINLKVFVSYMLENAFNRN